ncbi:cyclin-F-like [Diadema antillarum]|uniref:cyclin-F-like n=1 Tax=Diadema antillarum TaxID=105358 RepID=UPI003A841F67
MKNSCSRPLPSRAGRSPSITSKPTSLHVRVLRSNSRLPKTMLSDLPNELLLYLLKFLPLSDLQNVYRVNKQFKWLLDSTPRIWANASVVGRWPSSSQERKCFEEVADLGNVEALIKLGVAHLYSEGVDSQLCKDGSRAAKYFAKAEKLAPGASPFTWLLIRPPWSNNGTCCKARVFSCLRDICTNSKEADQSVLFCLAKLHSFLEEMDSTKNSRVSCESREWLSKAAEKGSIAASYERWKNSLTTCADDAASNLNILRQLREFASQGCLDAKLRLYSEYAKGNLGGVSRLQGCEAIRSFVQESQPTNVHSLLRTQSGLNSAMRYILVDWLVEVGSMKDYSCLTIHTAVQLVDRYLMARNISRATLQLVGITCMVICSRLLEDDIITIREAAWLTDGTYKYEEVVRMLGDVVATLKGNLRDLTVLDYLHLFCQVVAADSRMEYLALYISELSLLHADFGLFSRSHIAACSLYLARLMLGSDFPWPTSMVEHTGLELKDLVQCTLLLHNKCFLEEPVKDHRDVTLAAVKQRFSEDLFLGVSKQTVMDHATLRTMLCVEEEEQEEADESTNTSKMDPLPSDKDGLEAFLLMSPSRKSRGQRKPRGDYLQERHDRVSTPTHEFPDDAEIDLDIKPIEKDVNECDVSVPSPEYSKPSLPSASKHSKGSSIQAESSASWVVLDESPSISAVTSNSLPASSKIPVSPRTIPSSSSCFMPLESTSSSSSTCSASKTNKPVTYTISSSGRLCQQRVRTRKMGASPISGRRRMTGCSGSSSSSGLQGQLTPGTMRYQFRKRTPLQSFKRKTMEDSSDEGAFGH